METKSGKTAGGNGVPGIHFPQEIRGRIESLLFKHGLRLIEQFTNGASTRYSFLALNHAKEVFWWVGGCNGDDKLEPVTLAESVRIYADEKIQCAEGSHSRCHLRTWLLLVHRALRSTPSRSMWLERGVEK